MSTKTKIGVAALMVGAFVGGGFLLNALDVDAFGWGFQKGNSEEWQAKMEEFKAMTPEERQEHKEQCMEDGEGFHYRIGNQEGFLKGFVENADREIETLENGVQITITSDDPEIVEKLHGFADKINAL